jgi:archaemetzincin
MAAVRPLHHPLGKPEPGDWLSIFPEPGQTFEQYLRSRPTLPQGRRRILYVQPLGEFTENQEVIVGLAAYYMERFFNVPIKIEPAKPLADVPAQHRRIHPSWGMEQVQTGYIFAKILRPNLPEDAVALIAFTTADLYPNEKMNFLFGQASLRDRIGVRSLYRLGDPDAGPAGFTECLLRTLKIATHETGHMFSLWHCTRYQCNMNGSNSLEEMDRRPLELCPECMAKVCWAMGCNPRHRYERLAAFFHDIGREELRSFFLKEAQAVSSLPPLRE